MPQGKKKPEAVSIEDLFLVPRKKSTDSQWRGLLMRAYKVCISINKWNSSKFAGTPIVNIATAADLLKLQLIFRESPCFYTQEKNPRMVWGDNLGIKVADVIKTQLAAHGFKLKVVRVRRQRASTFRKGTRYRL